MIVKGRLITNDQSKREINSLGLDHPYTLKHCFQYFFQICKYCSVDLEFLQFVATLGKQEFKGRNKRNTLAARNRAQARRTESPLLVSSVCKYLIFLFCLVLCKSDLLNGYLGMDLSSLT